MELKSNDATPKRPEGDRLLNATFVEMDLNEFIAQIKSEESWAENDRNSLTIYKSETLRLVLIGLHPNAELKPHKANGVINVQVLEGKIDFGIADHHSILQKNQMIAVQEGVMHSVKALEESFFLLSLVMK